MVGMLDIGSEVFTAYGWGIVCGKYSLNKIAVKLDWNGVLYTNIDSYPPIKSSSCDLGQCVLTANGTHMVINYNRDKDTYDTVCFSPIISEHCITAKDIIKLLPLCVGLPANMPDVKGGQITNYVLDGDKFELTVGTKIECLPSLMLSNAFPYRRLYPISWYIIKNYLTGHNVSTAAMSAIDSYTTTINSQVDVNQRNSAVAQIQDHLTGMHQLLLSCSERIASLQLSAKDDSTAGLNTVQLKVIYCIAFNCVY